MSEFRALAETLGQDIVASVKADLGEDYASLTDEQKQSIEDTGVRVVELGLRLKATSDPIEKAELEEKLQAVESTVKDWKVWGKIGAADAFWKGVQKVALTLGTFLGGLAGEAVSRLVPGLWGENYVRCRTDR